MENDAAAVGSTFRVLGQKAVGVCLLLALIGTTHAADTILRFFAGGTADGAFPQGDLTISDGTLYGMTSAGGLNDSGTIFRMDAVGGSFSVLKDLASGSNPSGSLTLDGTTLYGMTNGGGSSGFGTVFKIGTDGNGFIPLISFSGGAADGRNPLGSLLLSGSTLFGMTQTGGAAAKGLLFSMDVSGLKFAPLHSFVGGSTDGSNPVASLVLGGGILYGMTTSGGASGGGAVFKVGQDGAGFGLVQSLSGGNPQGSLILVDSMLYGMTSSGGTGGSGIVFRVGIDGMGFEVLHNFGGGVDDGSLPSGSLALVGSTLYGTTQTGGTVGLGTVFQMNLDGSGFEIVHSFSGGISDGASPQGSLVLSNGLLYGTTSGGGSTNNGTIFTVAVPEPGVIWLGVLAAFGLALLRRRAALTSPRCS
ncbi:MAG: hypothetical protein PHC88_10480 [Terrimicrobiaceae bacterium]|nr:hypothetical protein [Terrimicrobiaceae bacterium]